MINLNDYLYDGDTVVKILHRYSRDLKASALETGNGVDLAHSNCLLQMIELLEHNDFLTCQSQQIREFYKYLADKYPFLAFTFKGRIKSLIRLEEKINGNIEVQLRTKQMDDIAEIGPAYHLGYEARQEKERMRRQEIPVGANAFFDDAYERGMMLQQLDLKGVDVNMFGAVNNSLVNDGCGLYRGRLILPYEHLSRFQNDLIG